MKKLNKEDFNIEFLSENELEMTIAGEDGDVDAQAYSQNCYVSVSVTVSLVSVTSTTKCSNATNTYTELSCC